MSQHYWVLFSKVPNWLINLFIILISIVILIGIFKLGQSILLYLQVMFWLN